MVGFRRVTDFVESEDNGQNWKAFVHKTGTPILPAARWWADMSMGAGTPKFNAYVGAALEATPIVGTGNAGIYHGGNVSPLTKHLSRIAIGTPANIAPMHLVLCDYLMFYPLIDLDSTDQQEMVNVATLPRYNGGRLILVSSVPQTANATATIGYTNESGQERAVTASVLGPSNTGCINNWGALSTNANSPFVPLSSGDQWVSRVDSLTMNASAGGFVSAVIVRPLATTIIRELNTITESSFMAHKPSAPRVMDGAYLNFIFSSGLAAGTSVVRAELDFYWN